MASGHQNQNQTTKIISTNSGANPADNSVTERQRATAVKIAKQKVLAAFAISGHNLNQSANQNNKLSQRVLGFFSSSGHQLASQANPSLSPQELSRLEHQASSSTLKNNPISPQIPADFSKYHTAWQEYYKKYYNLYYANAAKVYLETEQMKNSRQSADAIRNDDFIDEDHNGLDDHVEDRLRSEIRKLAQKTAKSAKKRRFFWPIIAGISVTLILLFLQYNRLIFSPLMAYLSPNTSSDDGISALDATVATAVSDTDVLIIPKLNINVPVFFGISNDTDSVNEAMKYGVAHFRIPGASAFPGEIGNVVISGHSGGDIYTNYQYKFIFSGLERLTVGDLIYIDYQGVRFTYQMTDSTTVDPTDVNSLVLDTDKPMLTLLTCWPTGTSTYRLLIFAEQINPSYTEASEQEIVVDNSGNTEDSTLPDNDPTFFESVWNWLTGN